MLDITGGAPELHPKFKQLVKEVRSLNVEVMDRCNLTILTESGHENIASFLASNKVQITASLPCYLKDNVDKQRGKGVFEKSIFLLLGLTFLFATFLSFYHFGIEQGFIEESAVCDLEKERKDLSKEDLLKQLKSSSISCKNVDFRFFGLSLATINIFISLIFSIITFRIFLNYEKN